jgi:hypothetical protein
MKLPSKKTPFLAPIHDNDAQDHVVSLIKKGFPAGIFNRGVCAIWGNGDDYRFVESIQSIKGEKRGEKPLAATLSTERLVKMIDVTMVHSSLIDILTNHEELSVRTGSLCFLRVPITKEAALSLPKSMISFSDEGTPILQNWDPFGHQPVHDLYSKLIKSGIKYPAITSMNISGTPEMVDQKEGEKFSKEKGIPVFLHHPDYEGVLGGYTILGFDLDGVRIVREGNIKSNVFDYIFPEFKIDKTKAKPSKYPQRDFPLSKIKKLSPKEARITVLEHAILRKSIE